MRKAHQNEVQREIARFKQEFISQYHSNTQDMDSLSAHKERELQEIRQEILSLSEKYSMKCVETISLEEKLRVTEQKLKQIQQQFVQLDAR